MPRSMTVSVSVAELLHMGLCPHCVRISAQYG